MSTYLHPEVLPAIKAEFDKLHAKHPAVDGCVKWKLATQYVIAELSVDTSLYLMQLKDSK